MNKYIEAEKALIIKSSLDNVQVAGDAAGYYLLGRISEHQAKTKEAIKHYYKSLELNPTLWISFERLCKLDPKIKLETIFKDSNTVIRNINSAMIHNDYFNRTGESLDNKFSKNTENRTSHPKINPRPVPQPSANETDSSLNSKKSRHSIQPALTLSSKKRQTNNKKLSSKNTSDNPFSMTTEVKRSMQLSPQIKIGIKTTKKQEYTLMKLLGAIGTAYLYLSNYNCTETIKAFKVLPKSQYNTAWVLVHIARALFETNKYTEAEKTYKEAFSLEPYKVEGMEYYSSCLWHLKKQVDLCELSNKVLQITTFAPEVWCVVGNTLSLQKEHENAIRSFNRAAQINPSFAYAYTLSGHEYAASDNFEQASLSYRKAISSDEKHYNAFWGMGSIFMRQEKYDQAIQYFRRAILINSRSPILYTYLGMTYLRKHQHHEAIRWFEQAEKLDPLNSLVQYQKATVLISLNQFENALNTLEELKKRLPKEAPVYVLIGKIHTELGNKSKALLHFNMAIDLNPKETNIIKSLIDKMEVDSLEV
jgi:anaphase-promoting complex subunit 3